jgi:hypothetical protein
MIMSTEPTTIPASPDIERCRQVEKLVRDHGGVVIAVIRRHFPTIAHHWSPAVNTDAVRAFHVVDSWQDAGGFVHRTGRHDGDSDDIYSSAYSAGMIALWRCAERWDPSRRVKFSTYAWHRVRGAIRDLLRSMYREPPVERPRAVEVECKPTPAAELLMGPGPCTDDVLVARQAVLVTLIIEMAVTDQVDQWGYDLGEPTSDQVLDQKLVAGRLGIDLGALGGEDWDLGQVKTRAALCAELGLSTQTLRTRERHVMAELRGRFQRHCRLLRLV